MVPTAWCELPALPLTPTGKVDRLGGLATAIASPRPSRGVSAAVVPRTVTERALASLWCALLGLPAVGVHDNFFNLGGHSLLAARLLTRIRSAFGVQLELRALFAAPTIAALAAALDARLADGPAPDAGQGAPSPDAVTHCPVLSFGQERLWFLEQLDPGSPAYNVAWTIHCTGPLDVPALRAALDGLVARHPSLRTRFPAVDGRPVPVIDPPAPLPLRRRGPQHRRAIRFRCPPLRPRPRALRPGTRSALSRDAAEDGRARSPPAARGPAHRDRRHVESRAVRRPRGVPRRQSWRRAAGHLCGVCPSPARSRPPRPGSARRSTGGAGGSPARRPRSSCPPTGPAPRSSGSRAPGCSGRCRRRWQRPCDRLATGAGLHALHGAAGGVQVAAPPVFRRRRRAGGHAGGGPAHRRRGAGGRTLHQHAGDAHGPLGRSGLRHAARPRPRDDARCPGPPGSALRAAGGSAGARALPVPEPRVPGDVQPGPAPGAQPPGRRAGAAGRPADRPGHLQLRPDADGSRGRSRSRADLRVRDRSLRRGDRGATRRCLPVPPAGRGARSFCPAVAAAAAGCGCPPAHPRPWPVSRVNGVGRAGAPGRRRCRPALGRCRRGRAGRRHADLRGARGAGQPPRPPPAGAWPAVPARGSASACPARRTTWSRCSRCSRPVPPTCRSIPPIPRSGWPAWRPMQSLRGWW